MDDHDLKQRQRLYQVALNKWGVEAQLRMAQEECAELIVAISHSLRKGKALSTDAVVDEIGDVEVMIEQLRFILDRGKAIEASKQRKLEKLREKLGL